MIERSPSSPAELPERRQETAIIGFCVFLASEVLFFGALFAAFTAYRTTYPAAFSDAACRLAWVAGGLNTAVLLTSSLAMALADFAAERAQAARTRLWLAATAALGAVFVAVKFAEYAAHIREGLLPGARFAYAGAQRGQAELFFVFYFTMTGLHALHLLVGIVLTGALAVRRAARPTHVRIVGLYWHFVDVVCVFLFPLLYLL